MCSTKMNLELEKTYIQGCTKMIKFDGFWGFEIMHYSLLYMSDYVIFDRSEYKVFLVEILQLLYKSTLLQAYLISYFLKLKKFNFRIRKRATYRSSNICGFRRYYPL
jgi:hypothetical protein